MMNKEDEGFVLVALLHPLDALIGDDVGAVALLHTLGSVVMDESGIVVLTLPHQNVVVIETCGCAHQVPFADECRLVASGPKQFGHGLLGSVKDTMLIVGEPVLMAVLAREHAGPGRAAQRVGHKTLGKHHTLLCNTVEVGRGHRAVAIARHHLRRMVVCHDIDDIGALLSLRPSRHEKGRCQGKCLHIGSVLCQSSLILMFLNHTSLPWSWSRIWPVVFPKLGQSLYLL